MEFPDNLCQLGVRQARNQAQYRRAFGLPLEPALGHADAWGAALLRAGECLGFLLKTGLPLLALMVFMLWRAAPHAPQRALWMGALASAGAAASLLTLVHPHAASLADLCAHATAIVVVLGIGAAAASLRGRSPSTHR